MQVPRDADDAECEARRADLERALNELTDRVDHWWT
jgi:hypothetical protein